MSASKSDADLACTRAELKRLGYLDRRVERFLLQDTFRPGAPLAGVVRLAAKIGLILGLPSAAALALLLLAWNGELGAHPFEFLPLFAHLAIPAVLLPAVLFLMLAACAALLLKYAHWRRIEALSLGLATAAALLLLAFCLVWLGRGLDPMPAALRALLFVLLPALAYGVQRLLHDGLLALAMALTNQAPERPYLAGWRAIVWPILLTLTLGLMAFLSRAREPAVATEHLPLAPQDPLLVVAVDGVLPAELEFLLGSGALPTLQGALSDGALFAPTLRSTSAPSAYWTSVATGLPSARHGIESIDAYRPIGVSRPLVRGRFLKPFWQLESRLGLAEYRPVMAGERRAPTFWELVGRGGVPTLVVGWWGTFPLSPQPGRHLAHGAAQMLADPPSAIAEPPQWLDELRQLPRGRLPAGLAAGLQRLLAPADFRLLVDLALLPDEFYRSAFVSGLAHTPGVRSAALYLPGLDIGSGLTEVGPSAQAELVGWQLKALDELLAREAGKFGAWLLIFDPGRRGGREGRLLVRPARACVMPGAAPIGPEEIGSLIMRLQGLPQSQELPEPPSLCSWTDPPLRVPAFPPRVGLRGAEEGEEYLKNLKSLGYL